MHLTPLNPIITSTGVGLTYALPAPIDSRAPPPATSGPPRAAGGGDSLRSILDKARAVAKALAAESMPPGTGIRETAFQGQRPPHPRSLPRLLLGTCASAVQHGAGSSTHYYPLISRSLVQTLLIQIQTNPPFLLLQ